MGTYYIPRNTKGESRILMIFSVKGLIYTCIGAGIGLIFMFIFSMLNLKTAGYICIAIFALLGFAIGTFKVPNTQGLEFTKKTGGQNIDDVIKRALKFKLGNKKIYVYEDRIRRGTKDE